MLILIVYRGPNKGQVFKLSADRPHTLGRGVPPTGVTDSKVSTRHCRFTQRDGTWWLEDLKSRNGTYVNHVKLDQAVALRDGDRVQLGETRVAVAMAQADPSDSMVGAHVISAQREDDDTGIVIEADDAPEHTPEHAPEHAAEHDHDLVAAELDGAAGDSAHGADAPDINEDEPSHGSAKRDTPRGLLLTGEQPVTTQPTPQAPPARHHKLIAASAILAALVALALGVFSVLQQQGVIAPPAPATNAAIDTDALSSEVGEAIASRLSGTLEQQSKADRAAIQQVLARLETIEPGQAIDSDALVRQLAAAVQQDAGSTRAALDQLAAKQDQAIAEAKKAQATAFTREDLQNVLDGQTTLDARLAALTDQLETVTDRASLAKAVADRVTTRLASTPVRLADDDVSRLREQVAAAISESKLAEAISQSVDERFAEVTPRLDQITQAIASQPESDAPWEALSQTMAQLREQVAADAQRQQTITDALARLEEAQSKVAQAAESDTKSLAQIQQTLADAARTQTAEQANARLEQRITKAVTQGLSGLATQDQVKLLAGQRVALSERIDEVLNRITALTGGQSDQTRQLKAVAARLEDTANDDRPGLARAVAELREVAASLERPADQQQANELAGKIDQLLAQRALLEQVAEQARGSNENALTPQQVEQIVTAQTTRLESRIAALKRQLDEKPSAGQLLAPIRQAIASAAKGSQPRVDELIAQLREADPEGAADQKQVIDAVRDIVSAQGSSTELLLKELQSTLADTTRTDKLAETIQQALDRQASTSRAMLEELDRKLEHKPSSDKVVAAVGKALRERTVETQSLLENLLAEVDQIEQTRAQLEELVAASKSGQAQRDELREMTRKVQQTLGDQGSATLASLSRLEQNTQQRNNDAQAFAGEVSKDVADRLSRAVSLQLEAAALAGQDSQAQEVAPLLRQVLAELRQRDSAAAAQPAPVRGLDPSQLEDAMAGVRSVANNGSWQAQSNLRYERMTSPRTSATRGRGYTAQAAPYRQYQSSGNAPAGSPRLSVNTRDGLTELQRAYRRAWVTNQPVVLGSGGFDAASGTYTEPRILDPVVAREAGITRWQDWYMADDFNERMKLRGRIDRYRQQTAGNDRRGPDAPGRRADEQANSRSRDVTRIPPVPLPPAQ